MWFCGCLAIIISKLNRQVECLRLVADIGTFIFYPKNLVVVVNKELCSEAITLAYRYKEDILKNFMLSFCVRDSISSYFLTPWSRVLLEKLTGLQLVKKFPTFYGTRKFITVFTSARQLSLSWPNSIQSPPPPTSWRSILILSSHLRLGLPNGLFPSGFPTRTLCTPHPSPHLTPPHARHMPRPPHSSRFYHPHNIG